MGSLTALKVKSLGPGRHSDGEGLYLLVKESGARSWVLRVQVEGRRRDIGIGPFPSYSLADAREEARKYRKLATTGHDPKAARDNDRAAPRPVPTFAAAARACFEKEQASWRNAKHRAQWLTSLETYAFPIIGKVAVDKIDAPMIAKVLNARSGSNSLWLEKPETGRRVRQRIASVLNWSHGNGDRSSEAPMHALGKLMGKQPKQDRHFAAMPYADVPAFVERLDSEPATMGRMALLFTIYTAARSGETRGMTWSEVDLSARTWTIPGSRMKAEREHIVALSAPAVAMLERAAAVRSSDYVFPGAKGRPLSDMTLSKVLRDRGLLYTVHGFRSSFRDWAAEQTDTAGEIVEAALAHTIANKVEAAYRRTNYLEKRRVLMASWANYLAER